ncbi:MAG: hypothetical protein H0U88_00570 [Chthoniobacterales bacterium]|nr:hypothetical protein [Chthoniobacterales bacterium]
MKSHAIILASLAVPSLAFACTVCDTDTGEQLRAGIFGSDFWSTLLVVVSPFPVLLLTLAAIHLGFPSSPSVGVKPGQNGSK